jgi:GT2 family glycosyltransferase
VSQPSVSAVIVAWNSGEALASCVESLRASATAAEMFLQLVIVENASHDDAATHLELGPRDLLLRNPINAGYGVAAAQGLARAEAEWALLVNPDVAVEPGFFEALGRAMRSIDGDVAALVPELRYASSPGTVNSRGIAVDDIGIPAEVDLGADVVNGLSPREVLGGSSGCCLLRCDAVRAIGGPEPIFFAYLEDVDLAIRLQEASYRALLIPDAVAWHEGSASTREGSPVKSFLVARNRRILFHLHGPDTLRAWLWRLAVDPSHGLTASLLGDAGAPWLGRLDALRLRRYIEFLRVGRVKYDTRIAETPYAPRVGLLATLRRKRTAGRMMER